MQRSMVIINPKAKSEQPRGPRLKWAAQDHQSWARFMPGYKNPNLEEAEQLNTEAAELFTEGTDAGETAVKYVRLTVLFALVLFLIAAGQRFRQRPVRISANALAVCLLIYTVGYLTILPRL